MKFNKKVFFFFLFYTFVFTLPVALNIFTQIPGKYSDTYQVWGKALDFRNFIEINGVFTAIIFQIKNLRFSPIEFMAWLQAIFNPHFGYNLVWLFSFGMAAVGMYKLVDYLTKNKYASIVAAIIFAFHPFHFSQAISTNFGTMHYEWIPFFILYLLKFLRGFKLKDFLLSSLFLIILAFTEHQLLAFTLILALILIFAYLAKNSEVIMTKKFLIYFLSGVLVFLISIKFIFGGLLQVANSTDNYLDPGIDQVKRYSTDLIEIFIPSRLHPIWGESLNKLRDNSPGNNQGRQSNYLGYTALILAVFSLFSLKKRPFIKLFFFLNLILFVIFSFGPLLYINGEEQEKLWMPYRFLYDYVPYWDLIRTVNRIQVIVIFCLAISAAFGLDYLIKKYFSSQKAKKAKMVKSEKLNKLVLKGFIKAQKFLSSKGYYLIEKLNKLKFKLKIKATKDEVNRFFKSIFKFIYSFFPKTKVQRIVLLILALISLEYISIPVPLLSMEASPFYTYLKNQEGDFKVIDLPGATSYDYGSKLMHYNMIHLKENLAGIDFARVIEDEWTFQRDTPVLYDLMYSLPTGGNPPKKSIINDNYLNLATKILNFYNIKYIIISKQYLEADKKFDKEAFKNTIIFIEGYIDSKKVYEDDKLIAYEINQSNFKDGWFMAVDTNGDYWQSKEGSRGSVSRYAKDQAKIRLVNLGKEPLDLHFLFDTRVKKVHYLDIILKNEAGERQVGHIKLKDRKQDNEVIIEDIPHGENHLVFRITNEDGNTVYDFEFNKGVKFKDVRSFKVFDESNQIPLEEVD